MLLHAFRFLYLTKDRKSERSLFSRALKVSLWRLNLIMQLWLDSPLSNLEPFHNKRNN